MRPVGANRECDEHEEALWAHIQVGLLSVLSSSGKPNRIATMVCTLKMRQKEKDPYPHIQDRLNDVFPVTQALDPHLF